MKKKGRLEAAAIVVQVFNASRIAIVLERVDMKKRRYPKGKYSDRITSVLRYISSNPGCRRMNIQAHMNHIYKATLTHKTVSSYIEALLSLERIEWKEDQFFITPKGKKTLEREKKGAEAP